MRLIDYVEQKRPLEISVHDNRTLLSSQRIAISAGGPGSGRKKVEDFLQKSGFSKSIVRGTKDGNDWSGASHWHKKIMTNPEGLNSHSENLNTVTHTVTVKPDGSWNHTVTGIHGGHDLNSIKGLNLESSGNSLAELRVLVKKINA